MFADDILVRVIEEVAPDATHVVGQVRHSARTLHCVVLPVDVVDACDKPAGPSTAEPLDLVSHDIATLDNVVCVGVQSSYPSTIASSSTCNLRTLGLGA